MVVMRLGGSLARSISRSVSRQISKEVGRRITYHRVQSEAASRPESRRVETPAGVFWMSPIEFKLYEAMCKDGLSPVPQYRIEGYIVDFAFPDVGLAVEADGVAYHTGERRERDRKRDRILRRHGWTVKRFYGTTIHSKAANCAFVVKREVEGRRMQARAWEARKQIRRTEQRNAILGPFRKAARLILGKK